MKQHIYFKTKGTLHHIVCALIVGHFSMDAVGIFLRFSGHALSVEVQTRLLKLPETGVVELG